MTDSAIDKVLAGIDPSDAKKHFEHHGVKGMKWGVRRTLQQLHPSERAGYIAGRDAKWLAKVEANPKLAKISSKAAREAKGLTKKLKQDYKDRGINLKKDPLQMARYDNELKGILERSLDNASYKVHKYSPSRLSEVRIHRHPDGTITALVAPRHNAKIVKQQGKIAKADAKRAKVEAKAMSHDDMSLDTETDFDGLEFILDVDDKGFVDDISVPGDLAHAEAAEFLKAMGMDDTSLAHYGRKGMKWGRHIFTDVQLGRLNRKQAKIEEKQAKVDAQQKQLDSTGAANGTVRVSVKNADGKNPAEIHISADAERFIKTHQKSGIEMSDREIKEAIQRANIVKQYNDMFAPNPNSELKAKVEALQLQRDYSQLQAQMRPPTAAQRLIKASGSAFTAYTKLNDATGGEMNKALEQAMGLKSTGGKHKSKESAFGGKRKK